MFAPAAFVRAARLVARAVCLFCAVAVVTTALAHAQDASLADVVRDALRHNPSVQHQSWQVDARRGDVVSARGALDAHLTASTTNERSQPLHASPASETPRLLSKTTALATRSQVGLRKPFAFGLSVEPFLRLEQSRSSSVAGRPLLNTALGLRTLYALGRGRSVAPARQRAARHRLDAASLHARFVASDVAYQTTRRYWAVLAAQRRVDVVAASVERAERLLHDTRMLVQRDEKPAADLTPLWANLANRHAQRIEAERGLASAWEALHLVRGRPQEARLAAAPTSSSFPPVPSDLETRLASPTVFVALALHRRTDLAASKHRRTAARHDRTAASDARRPRLDVSVDVNYAGLGPGGTVPEYVSPFAADVQGLNATVRLTTDLSFRNRAARGALRRHQALYRQRDLAVRDRERTVEITVATTVAQLRGSVHQLRQAQQAVDLYRQIITDEETKYRMGMATLFNVIEAEDRLTRALTAAVDAHAEYAGLVARLRFQTQTILAFDASRPVVVPHRLTTLPRSSSASTP